MATQTVSAIVSHSPTQPGHPNWSYSTIKVRTDLQPGELLVRIVGAGICHTDIYSSTLPPGYLGVEYPKVLGHEGAGYVEAVGSGVTIAAAGDPVLLSYDYCEQCDLCQTGPQGYCEKFTPLNIPGQKGDFVTEDGEEVQGKFFGQSSFSSLAVVKQTSVVNVKGLVSSKDELKMLAPFGCGSQTGAGAVVNAGKAKTNDVLLVTGLGGVGLSAVMAGKIVGCRAIVAVDLSDSRLATARELGATHLLNSKDISKDDLAPAIQKAAEDMRISLAIETTGVSVVIAAAIKALGHRGKFVQIGIPQNVMGTLEIPWIDFWGGLKTLEPNIEGSSIAKEFVPKMIQWWRQGKFPIEKLVQFFEAKDVGAALKGMEDGSVVKPVLVFS